MEKIIPGEVVARNTESENIYSLDRDSTALVRPKKKIIAVDSPRE